MTILEAVWASLGSTYKCKVEFGDILIAGTKAKVGSDFG
jgi:hypothetical protein